MYVEPYCVKPYHILFGNLVFSNVWICYKTTTKRSEAFYVAVGTGRVIKVPRRYPALQLSWLYTLIKYIVRFKFHFTIIWLSH